MLFFGIFALYAFAKQPSAGGVPASVAGASEAPASVASTEFPIASEAESITVPLSRNAFLVPTLTAAAILVKDAASGAVIYQKNHETRLPIASLTKLMTALVAVKYGDLDDEVEISPADLEVSAYRVGFSPGEKVAVADLLKAMLISSANDAALALARYSAGSTENFVKEMNDQAVALGMTETSFANPIGFDSPAHYSTAADLSKLVEAFISRPELLDIVKLPSAIVRTVSGKESRQLYTTNLLLRERPGVIGLKTGYTAEAKGSIIILMGEPRYYSIVLGSREREKETSILLDWVEKEFVWN